MKKFITKVLHRRQERKDLEGLYRYCQLEYKSQASYMFQKLREENNV